MNAKLPHEIVTVVGRTGSGKTRLIASHIGPRHARRITLDSVGEGEALYPDAFRAFGLERVFDALRAWSREGVRTWHMVAILSPDETGQLMHKLAPQYDGGATESLSALFGGVCVECFEIDLYLPVSGGGGKTAAAFQHAVARGRHVGLSLLCATQRPAQCHRILTSQSQHVVSFAMHEPRDLRWLSMVGGERFARIAHRGLRRYESAWYSSLTHRIVVRDASYAVRYAEAEPTQGDMFHDR